MTSQFTDTDEAGPVDVNEALARIVAEQEAVIAIEQEHGGDSATARMLRARSRLPAEKGRRATGGARKV